MAWMGGWFDPELEDLFHDEPELLETAQRVRSARPLVESDPRFQHRLRAQLVAEASRGSSVRGVRRWWRLGPAHVAWGGAFVGAALITATVLTFVSNHSADQTVTAFVNGADVGAVKIPPDAPLTTLNVPLHPSPGTHTCVVSFRTGPLLNPVHVHPGKSTDNRPLGAHFLSFAYTP